MYPLTVLFHSWLRWGVLASLLVCLVRAIMGLRAQRDVSLRDRRWLTTFLAVLDTQLLLGLTLYFVVSPITPRSLADLKAQMPVAYLRFFAVEHVTLMLLALIAAHVTVRSSRAAPTPAARQRRLAIGLGLTLLLILAGIPWPFLAYGRPLWREI